MVESGCGVSSAASRGSKLTFCGDFVVQSRCVVSCKVEESRKTEAEIVL